MLKEKPSNTGRIYFFVVLEFSENSQKVENGHCGQ